MVKISTTGWLLILLYFTSTAVLEAEGYSCCETIKLKWSSAPQCNFSDLEPEPLGQYVEYGNCLGRPSYKRAWVPGPTHMTDTFLYYYIGWWYISDEPCVSNRRKAEEVMNCTTSPKLLDAKEMDSNN